MAWLRKEKVVFIEHFCGTSIVREKMVSVILEYVPITHNPDALAENRRIEHNSDMHEGALVSTRWIKLEQR